MLCEGFGSTKVVSAGLSMIIGALEGNGSGTVVTGGGSFNEVLLGKVGRTIGLGVVLPGEAGFEPIGPTITLGGGGRGAGAGM